MLRSRHFIIPDSWANKPNDAVDHPSSLLVGQMNLLVIPDYLSKHSPQDRLFVHFHSHCLKDPYLFPLSSTCPSSPSLLRSGIMSSRRLLLFTTLRTPGQVQVRSGHARLITKMHVIGCTYHIALKASDHTSVSTIRLYILQEPGT